MANKYGIPDELEEKIRKKYKICVYCHRKLKAHPHTRGTPKDKATIEHIDNDGSLISEGNLVMCCHSCNTSKGTKNLFKWFKSDYCEKKNINKKTVAKDVIKKYNKLKKK